MNAAALKRIVALAFLMTAAMPAGVALSAEHRLTLNEAIDLALQRNEGLLIERESLAASRAAVTAASGAYDPLVELDGAWSKSTEPLNSSFSGTSPAEIGPEFKSSEAGAAIRQLLPTGGALSLKARGARETDQGLALLSPAYRTRVGLELRQPLLRDRGTDAARLSVRVAKAGRDGANASLRRAITETVASVERSYWTLVAVRLGIEVRQQAVHLAEEQLGETQTRVETGSAPRTELAQPRAELERRRGDLLASREALARAENALKFLILDGAGDALWNEQLAPVEDATVEVQPVDVPASLERALSARPELAIADAVVKRRRAETAFARDGIWPSLDAVVSYDRFGIAGSLNPGGSPGSLPSELDGGFGKSFESLGRGDFDAARVALVLGLPIGNRAARGNAAVAQHVERQSETDLARVRKTIRAEVLDAAAALETAGQRIEAARSGREAAEIQLSAERDRYDTGLSTNFLVLTRQNDLSRARLDEISALTDYRTARTEMARATGSLMDEHGINVDGTGR
ncbi:MAG TPA: TolC family protein [Candidatus Eisenbacteria bacterium]|jgi:outer membrane protein TolC